MSDPLRTDPPHAPQGASDTDRDAKIEQLLLVGLDHYFAAQYDQAINVWTRALFLDRSHARARAYIERARSALAERQRQSEELLHDGVAAFHRGEGDEARRLLQAAMRNGAPHDEALSVLDRLNRLEQGAAPEPASPRSDRSRVLLSSLDAVAPSHRWGLLGWSALLVVGATAALFVAAPRGTEWPLTLTSEPAPLQVPGAFVSTEPVLPVPRRGEAALARAQALAASGHLRDALSTLDLVRPTDDQKADADRLRAEIQRLLLALARSGGKAQMPASAAENTGDRDNGDRRLP
jgi:tetratricopeptide (TPR) repeat protein